MEGDAGGDCLERLTQGGAFSRAEGGYFSRASKIGVVVLRIVPQLTVGVVSPAQQLFGCVDRTYVAQSNAECGGGEAPPRDNAAQAERVKRAVVERDDQPLFKTIHGFGGIKSDYLSGTGGPNLVKRVLAAVVKHLPTGNPGSRHQPTWM